MCSKKSFILKSTDGSEKKAIISLECDGFDTSGKVRLYNFPNEPLGIITLGFFIDGKVEKAGLTRVENMVYSFSCGLKKLYENMSCAVVNFSQGEINPILYGNCNGNMEKEEIFDSVAVALGASKSMGDVEKILDRHGLDFDEDLKEEIEKEINRCCDDCENCKYKKYYFNQENIMKKLNEEKDIDLENKEEKIDLKTEQENKYYKEIKSQINELFEKNPSEKTLENIFPNSKWVKVKVDDNGGYYVLGLLYEETKLKYICYGVPGVYQPIPPRFLSGFPSWLPLDQGHPDNFGYWLTYQDADSGQSVKAIVE